MVAVYLLFYFLLDSCHGTPLPRDMRQRTVGWVSDPNGRGTPSLIISCLVTLGLCVWSAMHLNIPKKGESQTEYWIRSVKWVALGVIIPELVVLSAWRQWLSARQMDKEIKAILSENERSGTSKARRYPWTMQHNYFAGMGGFVFDKEYLPHGNDTLFNSPERLTLTASGVLLLARCGHLPDIPKVMIMDKSKADGLSKAVVCVQAAWMIVQTLGRLIVHQPVTLLEVNTLGHIFCAFVIYILWWKKPKEVYAPVILSGDWASSLAAFMYMNSRISGKKPSGAITLEKWIKPELAELAWYPIATNNSETPQELITRATPEHGFRDDSKNDKEEAEERRAPANTGELNSHKLPMPGELRSRPAYTFTSMPTTVVKPKVVESHEPDLTSRARLAACTHAIHSYAAIRDLFRPFNIGIDTDSSIAATTNINCESNSPWKPELVHLVTDVATNWPSDYYLSGLSGELMGMALWLSSSLYGGIHIAAWAEFFPTYVERMLWRFSSTYIAACGLFWFLMCTVGYRWREASDYWDRFIELRAWKIEYGIYGLMATACGCAYVFARFFLVIDAVVSLRQLPNAAYDTPEWTSIFPHL